MQLSAEQKAVVMSDDETILVSAGPGSGKTRVLVERVRRLAASHDTRRFVIITFTNAASDELRVRLGLEVGYVGTLHGFMLRCLREHADEAGFSPDLQVIGEEQARALLDSIAAAHRYKGTATALEAAIKSGPARPPANPKPEQLIASELFQTLKRGNMATFDTLLHYGLKVAPFIHGFTHLFVDELQDSSDADAAIYRALPIRSKFQVGDVDQAVYSFRGGNIGNMLALAGDATVFTLEDNYRCGAAICRAANTLIRHNSSRIDKETRSVAHSAGAVVALRFSGRTAEQQAVAAQILQHEPDDCAVLVRSRALVQEWTTCLEGQCVVVRRRKAGQQPRDWALARLALAVLTDPVNDLAAFWLSEKLHGREKATAMMRQSVLDERPIAALLFRSPYGHQPDTFLDAIGPMVSRESLTLLRELRDALPKGATLADLGLRINETDDAAVEEGSGVTVTTMHGAKGREWPVVFLPDACQHIIPGGRKDTDTEEERRLMFVAITRAKTKLWLSHADTAPKPFGTGTMDAAPSRFIGEAGLTCQAVATKREVVPADVMVRSIREEWGDE